MNILHITPDFNYACGRSYYVYLLLKYFKKLNHNVLLASNDGDSFDRVHELEVPISMIKGLRSKNPISLARSIKQIREIVHNYHIDIIHTHHRYAELAAVQTVKIVRSKKPKTVHTALSIVNKKYNIEYRSDKIIAVSNSIAQMLVNRFGINKKKIEMISNFADTEEMHEIEVLMPIARDHGKFYNLLAIGRFHHEKNFEVLLKALHNLNDPEIRLILLGEGDKHMDYRTYINKHNLNVEIIVPQRNLLQYFLAADVCVLPSVRDPFPNFMLQCGLHKKPFIGANVDGIAELIIDCYNGLLFHSGHEDELAEKIKLFKTDKNLANECAHNLFSDVVNNYTQEYMIPKINSLYMRLLNTKSS
ncbi:MAG TPA: glycosyltransferase family 4 protein [Ignavibacteria bacterium]|jgi:glycosyltransferase involved in cell wall biosynthesis